MIRETLRLLTDALDGAGMTVMVAMDGRRRDADRRPDHAGHRSVDAVMPGMDGFEPAGVSSAKRA